MNKKALTIIFLIVATELIGFGIIIPVLPQIGLKLGVTGFRLGLLTATYSLFQFIAAPILGALSDKYGRKKLLVISQLGTVASYVILAFSQNFWMFLFARMVDGITGGNIAIARAYISDITKPEDRPRGMALIGMSFGLGFILGPAIGGIVFALGGSFMIAALIAGLMSLIALILTIVLLKEERHINSEKEITFKKFVHAISDKNILTILVASLIFGIAVTGFQMTLTLLTHLKFGLDEKANSLLFTYMGFLTLFVQGVVVRKANGHVKTMSQIAMILAIIALVSMAFAPSMIFVYIIMIFFSLSFGLLNAYMPSLLSTMKENDPEGEVMGAYEAVSGLGRVIGPIAMTSLFTWSISGSYLLGALAVVIALLLISKVPKKV